MRLFKQFVVAPAPAAPLACTMAQPGQAGGRPGSPAGRSNRKSQRMGLLRRLWAPRNDVAISVFFLMSLFCSFSYAEEISLPFAKGETITYAIKKLGIKAGEATLTFEGITEINGKQAYLIVFKADGFNFYDEERIYVDIKTYAPVMVLRNVNIFGSKEKIGEEYLTAEGKIKITKIVGTTTSQQVIEKKGQIDNIYGAIYKYRQQGTFKVGDKAALRLPTMDVTLKLAKTVKIDAAGKEYEAFFMESEPSKFQIWFDTSDKKIPLRINGAVGMANTTMVMISYKE